MDQEVKKFAEHLVKGVCDNLDQIDEKIAHHSTHWKLDRMTRIDRSLLRLAAFEMFWCEDIPGKVAINEAIELGKKYGTEESSSFLNGVLDALYKEKER